MSRFHDLAAAALSRLRPETAHRLSVLGLAAGLGPRDRAQDDPLLSVGFAGLRAPNCVGLAAGFDKDAEAPNALLGAGFGFVECGTVTPLPQPGNPRPRLFRLRADRAVINRFGFNSAGLEPFAARLAKRPRSGIVGANLGANKESTDRIGDYIAGLSRLWGLCDYFTVNISSPNTPGLRSLQSRAALDELGGRLAEARTALRRIDGYPVLLKVAPDLSEAEIRDIVESARAHGLDGIIVSNTTVTRPAMLKSEGRNEAGGLSGEPLRELSLRILKQFREIGGPELVLIGVGGVGSGADAYAKIRAGAWAIQLYTALAYEGPGLVRHIKRDLAARLRAEGFNSVEEARDASG